MSARQRCSCASAHRAVAADRRRYRRPRGRTNRSRTSPRAARAAGCASRVERAAGGALRRRRGPPRAGLPLVTHPGAPDATAPRRPRRRHRPCSDAEHADPGERRACSRCTLLAQRIARHQDVRRAAGERVDDRDLEAEPEIVDLAGRTARRRAAAPSVRSASRAGSASSPARPSARRAPRRWCRPAPAVERDIDAVESRIVLPAVLQVVDDLQRRAERVVRRPGRAALAMHVEHEAADRHGRIAAIVRSGRPSRRSAAWSRPAGTPSADPAHGAAAGRARPAPRAAARASGSPSLRPSRPASSRSSSSSFSLGRERRHGRRCRRRRARTRRRRGSARDGADAIEPGRDREILVAVALARRNRPRRHRLRHFGST